ncbi:hypothetical protein [Actinoplanes sp. OR16]|uniref:hypothetical protein n=1 Tax=Actinoplanes sp. OR16 TaxID=946334 RepID=UPI000FDA1966|nr:hypothetical protein [Actinoplanes sp. OR16]
MIWNFARKLILTAILVPLSAAGARKLSDTIDRRRGSSSRGTRMLRQGADTLQSMFGRKKRRRFGFL